MIPENKVTEIFVMADDFCKFFDQMMEKYSIPDKNKRKYHHDRMMSKAEIMLILIVFHCSGYRRLKHYYLIYVCVHLRHLFPEVVSYNRFVELEKTNLHYFKILRTHVVIHFVTKLFQNGAKKMIFY